MRNARRNGARGPFPTPTGLPPSRPSGKRKTHPTGMGGLFPTRTSEKPHLIGPRPSRHLRPALSPHPDLLAVELLETRPPPVHRRPAPCLDRLQHPVPHHRRQDL